MLKNYDYQKEKRLVVSESNRIHQINVAEIEMVYSESGISTLTLINNEQIVFSRNLSFFEKELNSLDFFKINRNTLVNARHIASFDCKNKTIKTYKSEKIKVSRRNLSKIRQYFCSRIKPFKGKNDRL